MPFHGFCVILHPLAMSGFLPNILWGLEFVVKMRNYSRICFSFQKVFKLRYLASTWQLLLRE